MDYSKQDVSIEHEGFRVVASLDKVSLVVFASNNPSKCMTLPLKLFDHIRRELNSEDSSGGTYRGFFKSWKDFRMYANNAMRYDNSEQFEEGAASPILRLHNFLIYHGEKDGYMKIHDLWLEQATPNDLVIPLELADLINDKYRIGFTSFKDQITREAERFSPPPSALF